MRRKGLLGFIAVIIVIAVAAFFTFGHKKTEAKKTVTVGVVGQTNQDEKIWNQVKKTAKEKYGVTVKVKSFTDYNQPNKALQEGEIDLNSFQHKAFLNAWNKANKGTLVPIGNTVIAPIRLYSYKYKNINELPKNATIADIEKNPKNLTIKELGAEQTARSLNDVDAAVVNNTYAIPAKLGDKQTIYTEPLNKDSEQWINVIVANKKDKDNEAYKAVVKSYQTDAVKKLIHKVYGNSEVTAWNLKLK
ncbi:MAG: MetQ/NlpA family ABC transporter substrate-binding protein [Ligilactobacillus salivarius]|nr:MetQ/NlpA family ABC transporter substrate-binding protein [Ligilactobacillus salivarius]